MADKHDGDDLPLNRRTYLALAGALATSAAGCLGEADNPVTMVEPLAVFGYGGKFVMETDSRTVNTASTSEVEPNDSADNATVIETGMEVTGELQAAEVDWFAFDASADEEFTVEFVRASASGVSAVLLYDPDGQHLNLRYVGSDAPVALSGVAAQTGRHLVEVADIEAGSGSYTLTVSASGSTGTPTETPSPTPTPTETPTVTATPTATPKTVAYGVQGYGELGYGGIGT